MTLIGFFSFLWWLECIFSALAENPPPHPLEPLHGVEGHDALLQQ